MFFPPPAKVAYLRKGRMKLKYYSLGRNSLDVQWLGLGAVTSKGLGQSLVGELRSCKMCGAAMKNI